MRDPTDSWTAALVAAWENADIFSMRRDAFAFAWIGLVFETAMVLILGHAPDLSLWPALILFGICEVAWYVGWAAWTKPRLPTIWEALAGQLITAALPVVHACRWFSEFGEPSPTEEVRRAKGGKP